MEYGTATADVEMDSGDQFSRERDATAPEHANSPRCSACLDCFDFPTSHLHSTSIPDFEVYTDVLTILAAAERNCLSCRLIIDILDTEGNTTSDTGLADLVKVSAWVSICIEFEPGSTPYINGQWSLNVYQGGAPILERGIEVIAKLSTLDNNIERREPRMSAQSDHCRSILTLSPSLVFADTNLWLHWL